MDLFTFHAQIWLISFYSSLCICCRISANALFHVCFERPLCLLLVVLECHIFLTSILLTIVVTYPDQLNCYLCIFFIIGSTFCSFLMISFLTLSLLVTNFVLREYFISADYSLLLSDFVRT